MVVVQDDDTGQDAKKMPVLVWGPQQLKEDALCEIDKIKTRNPAARTQLYVADQFIQTSLYGYLWRDQVHLSSNLGLGQAVFDREKQAVLRLVSAGSIDVSIKAEVDHIIRKLVKADNMLVYVAIEDAKDVASGIGSSFRKKMAEREIAAAEKLVQAAQFAADKNAPSEAVEFLKEAWTHAQNAIRLAR